MVATISVIGISVNCWYKGVPSEEVVGDDDGEVLWVSLGSCPAMVWVGKRLAIRVGWFQVDGVLDDEDDGENMGVVRFGVLGVRVGGVGVGLNRVNKSVPEWNAQKNRTNLRRYYISSTTHHAPSRLTGCQNVLAETVDVL